MERIQKTEFRSEHRLQIRFAMLSESNVRPHFKQALGVVVLISGFSPAARRSAQRFFAFSR
jgi:hypothetical protein